ncbi:hypothetical protein TrRE_jg559 [Triparma retinervis]|uniref:Formimidoyltransferase-cyclodeaminase n=1 Tax=Triparma retinervis TaxID=2557542 RepID=A0A9W6ZDY0_9STRA|nr:hypothetical protein TrRE_jg559 [Triparma retinervis]
MDVCPFIPVRNATMDDCVDCANRLGQRMGGELGIPVYLYERAARDEGRRKLPDIRQKMMGEYEGIEENIGKEGNEPDFGPNKFVKSWGATAVGARKFLIAYNINLLGTKEQANRIAFNVREKGRGPDKPGRFKNVAGIGWYVEEYGMSQISVNCTDFGVTNIHTVFESCREDAESMNLAVCGSELVGLVPLECFLDIADYYIEKENLFIVSEAQKVTLVVNRLGLNSVSPFIPSERIIDYKCKEEDPPLISMTVKGFVEILGARTAAPGGGSASALVAAMGAGLGAMMGWMTYGSVKFKDLDTDMRTAIKPLHNVMTALITRIDADTDAFNDYMVAMRLPKGTDEEKNAREAAMQEGLKVAIDVPLETMRVANVCWASMLKLAEVGNINSKSDLQVGARCLELGIWGCWKNVEINLKDIKDEEYKVKTASDAKEIWEEADGMCKKVLEAIEKR